MAASPLEAARVLFEELETLERAVVETLSTKPRALKASRLADLRVAAYLRAAQTHAGRLQAHYADARGVMQEEVAALSGRDGRDALGLFYARLEEVRANAEAATAAGVSSNSTGALGGGAAGAQPTVLADANAAAARALADFERDEVYGRFIDLSPMFDAWCNLPGLREARALVKSGGVPLLATTTGAAADAVDDASASAAAAAAAAVYKEWARCDYAAWLRRLPDAHTSLPHARTRLTRSYRRYVAHSANGVLSFFLRCHPLVDAQELLEGWAREFEAAWAAGAMSAWCGGVAGEGNGAGVGAGATAAAVPAPAALGGGAAGGSVALLDLMSFATQGDLLAALGGGEGASAAAGAALSAQLQARGLKAGGSVSERGARLWAVRGLAPDAYPKKLRSTAPPVVLSAPLPPPVAEGAGEEVAAASELGAGEGGGGAAAGAPPTLEAVSSTGGAAAGATAQPPSLDTPLIAVAPVDVGIFGASRYGGSPLSSTMTAAWCEDALLRSLLLVEETIADSRRRVEQRATRTYAEACADREAEEADANDRGGGGGGGGGGGMSALDEEEEEEDKPVYNPLNLPLGWDGKPIPYWLYKLHGLNQEFTCEICSGAVYQGRRTFDRHFQEPTHATGMRLLGVPNTKHFHDITKIADALSLYARIKVQLENEHWRPEAGEEFEDSLGNVLDRRTYDDLARQGLL